MKKAFVLSVILGVVSLASAWLDIDGLSYIVSGNTLTFYGEDVSGFAFNLQANDSSELGNDIIPAGFSTANHGVWYGSYGQLLGAGASIGTGDPITGVIYSFDFTPGTTNITFIYSSLAGTSQINMGGQAIDLTGHSFIPEPGTMALLGVGGIFLVHRRESLISKGDR